jgi:hypothetical protein
MAEGGAPKQKHHRVKDWREQRAARRARTGDTPEKLAERAKPGDPPSVAENANRAGLAGWVSGSF